MIQRDIVRDRHAEARDRAALRARRARDRFLIIQGLLRAAPSKSSKLQRGGVRELEVPANVGV